jgi:hypothetical protein
MGIFPTVYKSVWGYFLSRPHLAILRLSLQINRNKIVPIIYVTYSILKSSRKSQKNLKAAPNHHLSWFPFSQTFLHNPQSLSSASLFSLLFQILILNCFGTCLACDFLCDLLIYSKSSGLLSFHTPLKVNYYLLHTQIGIAFIFFPKTLDPIIYLFYYCYFDLSSLELLSILFFFIYKMHGMDSYAKSYFFLHLFNSRKIYYA